MANKNEASPEHDFPAGIGKPATRAFIGAGYTRLQQFAKVSEAELLKLHGVGPKALGIIGRELEGRGLSFADGAKNTKD